MSHQSLQQLWPVLPCSHPAAWGPLAPEGPRGGVGDDRGANWAAEILIWLWVQTHVLAFREAPVAVLMEAVPIARVVFVVRLPAFDKGSGAELTASFLLPSKGWLDVVKIWPQEEGSQPPRLAILLSLYSGGSVAWPERRDSLVFPEGTAGGLSNGEGPCQ